MRKNKQDSSSNLDVAFTNELKKRAQYYESRIDSQSCYHFLFGPSQEDIHRWQCKKILLDKIRLYIDFPDQHPDITVNNILLEYAFKGHFSQETKKLVQRSVDKRRIQDVKFLTQLKNMGVISNETYQQNTKYADCQFNNQYTSFCGM